jgi:hypothetical protein
MLYAAAYGFRLEVGNANSAIHSAALMYDSELGAFSRSFGGPIGAFFTYASGPFADQNRMGVFASYAIDGLNLRASIIDPDQTTSFWFEKPEYAISADYRIGGFTLSGAYARNAGGDPDLDEWFLGAAYSVMPGATVGLLYSQVDNDNPFFGEDGRLVTLYGNYRVDDITYRGYIAAGLAPAPFFWNTGQRHRTGGFMSLAAITARLRAAEADAGRAAGSVKLIAVSKVQPEDRVRAVLDEGHRLFGENRVQEAATRWPPFQAEYDGIELHLVGPLQTNKARQAVEMFAALHSLDRPKLANTLARLADERGQSAPTCSSRSTPGQSRRRPASCPPMPMPSSPAPAPCRCPWSA